MRPWRRLAALGTALLTVVVFAFLHQDTTSSIEILWAAIGSIATTFNSQVTWRRWRVNTWRKQEGINGLFAISAQGSAILRTAGLAQGVLILIGGLSAMTTPASVRVDLQLNDHLTAATVIGLGICVLFSAWYADRQAQQALEYQQAHPEE